MFLFPALASEQEIAKLESVSLAFRKVANKVKPSVVTINTKYAYGKNKLKNNPFFEHFERFQQPKGQGTGVIYDKKGIIVTNYHVIEDAEEIIVILNDGRELKAKLKGSDPKTDLAVLEVTSKDLKGAEIGDSDKVFVGDWAIAIGNAMGFSQTVTVGIISAKGRSGLRDSRDEAYEDFIQTDAAINRGNSGGPLCNIRGEVIGINSMIASMSGGNEGLAFTIPMNLVTLVVDQLLKSGKVKRGFLGVIIKNITPEIARQFDVDNTKGALIDDVKPDGPADMGGLKVGDIIVKVGPREIKNSADLRISIGHTRPGDEVMIDYIRNGKKMTSKIKIGSLERDGRQKGLLGLTVRKAEKGDLLKFSSKSGVVIESVQPDSPAAKAGLEPDWLIASVDKKKVNSVEDFMQKAKDSLDKSDKAVLLYVKSEGSGLFVVLEDMSE